MTNTRNIGRYGPYEVKLKKATQPANILEIIQTTKLNLPWDTISKICRNRNKTLYRISQITQISPIISSCLTK